MIFNPEFHHRGSIRLREYDYSKSGYYFVTICAQNRECLFGTIENNRMDINEIGHIVCQHWQELTKKFIGIKNQPFVVMPNHVHGIIEIMSYGCRGLINQTPTPAPMPIRKKENGIPLGEIIRQFKAKSTHTIRNTSPIYQVWQRNYYEHIIRDSAELDKIKRYIFENPQKWDEDENNLDNI